MLYSPVSFRKKGTINILCVKFTEDVNLTVVFSFSSKYPHLALLLPHILPYIGEGKLCLQRKKKKLFCCTYACYSLRSTKCLGAQTNSLIIFCIQGKI